MKELESNITVLSPSGVRVEDKHIENSLNSSEIFINSEFHEKESVFPGFRSSLKSYWLSYFSILILNLINVAISYDSEQKPFIYYIYIGSMIFVLTAIFVSLRSSTRIRIICLYIITCIHIIITDPTLYSTFISYNPSSISSLQLLIPIGIIFSNMLEKFTYTITSNILGLISLGLLIHSQLHLSAVLLQFFILEILIFFNFSYKNYKSTSIKNKEDKITPLEEIISQLNSTISNLDNIGKECCSCRGYLEFSLETISKVIEKLQRCKNIYTPRIDKITKNMDEEDKAFIEQNAHDSSPFQSINDDYRCNRRTRSESAIHVTKLGGLLKSIGKDWNFNTFFLKECTENSTLEVSGLYILSRFKLDSIFFLEDSKLEYFLKTLESKYLPNPYHNSCHGADVMSSYIFFITNSEILPQCTDIELLAGILATLGHDVGHPAKNNRFLVITKDPIAIQYNDISVLENMHSTILFQLIHAINIFEGMFNEQWCIFRKICIEMILATDMSKHFDLVEAFKMKYSQESDISRPDTRLDVFKIIIKASDIGHAAKTIDLHKKWCFLVIEEFFLQGDQEKTYGLPISMYCDRENTNISKSQAGFIKNIVLPLYITLNAMLKSKTIETVCILQLKENKLYWDNTRNLTRNQTFVENIESKPALERRRSSLPLKQN